MRVGRLFLSVCLGNVVLWYLLSVFTALFGGVVLSLVFFVFFTKWFLIWVLVDAYLWVRKEGLVCRSSPVDSSVDPPSYFSRGGDE